MGKSAVVAVLVGFLASSIASADALPPGSMSEWSAQKKVRRTPTRLRVVPGPGLLRRECKAWYVEERRLSGPVVTPRMQCWWVRW